MYKHSYTIQLKTDSAAEYVSAFEAFCDRNGISRRLVGRDCNGEPTYLYEGADIEIMYVLFLRSLNPYVHIDAFERPENKNRDLFLKECRALEVWFDEEFPRRWRLRLSGEKSYI